MISLHLRLKEQFTVTLLLRYQITTTHRTMRTRIYTTKTITEIRNRVGKMQFIKISLQQGRKNILSPLIQRDLCIRTKEVRKMMGEGECPQNLIQLIPTEVQLLELNPGTTLLHLVKNRNQLTGQMLQIVLTAPNQLHLHL